MNMGKEKKSEGNLSGEQINADGFNNKEVRASHFRNWYLTSQEDLVMAR